MKKAFISLKTCPLPHQLEVTFSYAEDGTFIIQKVVAGTWDARMAYEQNCEHPNFTQWVREACEAQFPVTVPQSKKKS